MSFPSRSTACCLIENNGEVDYYTHPDNVKIFGFEDDCVVVFVRLNQRCLIGRFYYLYYLHLLLFDLCMGSGII